MNDVLATHIARRRPRATWSLGGCLRCDGVLGRFTPTTVEVCHAQDASRKWHPGSRGEDQDLELCRELTRKSANVLERIAETVNRRAKLWRGVPAGHSGTRHNGVGQSFGTRGSRGPTSGDSGRGTPFVGALPRVQDVQSAPAPFSAPVLLFQFASGSSTVRQCPKCCSVQGFEPPPWEALAHGVKPARRSNWLWERSGWQQEAAYRSRGGCCMCSCWVFRVRGGERCRPRMPRIRE